MAPASRVVWAPIRLLASPKPAANKHLDQQYLLNRPPPQLQHHHQRPPRQQHRRHCGSCCGLGPSQAASSDSPGPAPAKGTTWRRHSVAGRLVTRQPGSWGPASGAAVSGRKHLSQSQPPPTAAAAARPAAAAAAAAEPSIQPEVADTHQPEVVCEESKQQVCSSERVLWRAARDYRAQDHYDYSLFGLDVSLDQAVARHQRDSMQYSRDRHLKEQHAKLVAPGRRQSPVALLSRNPAYEPQPRPLELHYPATVENLRLNNTGFSWEVKLPYQVSMDSCLQGAHLATGNRYKLDQFHCHWGKTHLAGSEHTVDGRPYSAELHFVHYQMDRYHTLARAARQPDGLAVVSVFLDAHDELHHKHAELDKVVGQLKSVPLKGQHSIIKQPIRLENLLPANRSYWSYQGSLTTPPYFESVTWFVFKQPIKCSREQLDKFRNLKSAPATPTGVGPHLSRLSPVASSSELQQQQQQIFDYNGNHQALDIEMGRNRCGHYDYQEASHEQPDDLEEPDPFIESNHRDTQPLNGRTIVSYDEPLGRARG